MSAQTKRIALWSGPRNISTAMMRAWGSRPDTFVTDEPLYAHYLRETGTPHPGSDEIIAQGETDWRKVAATLTGPVPNGKVIWFQKHMCHHLLPHIELDWLDSFIHCFLIREPVEMLASLVAVMPNARVSDTGLPQQVKLFDWLCGRTGRTPAVVDARDILQNPRGALEKLCVAVGVKFSDTMLHWPAGRRATDGVWAKYWYANVEQSTGFQPYQPKSKLVPSEFSGLLKECEALYRQLHEHRLR